MAVLNLFTKVKIFTSIRRMPVLVCEYATSNKNEESVTLKKPLSPFLKYVIDVKDKFKEKNPNVPYQDLIALLAKAWNNLPENEKDIYRADYRRKLIDYKEAKHRYFKKLENEDYVTRAESYSAIGTSLKMQKKLLGKPKMPKSAFFLFVDDLREQLGNKAEISNVISIGKEKWSKMSDEEKDVYKRQRNQEYEKYKSELTHWENEMISNGLLRFVRAKTLKALKTEEDS